MAAQVGLFAVFWSQAAASFFPTGYDQVEYLLGLVRIVAIDSDHSLFAGDTPQGWALHGIGAAWLQLFGPATPAVWAVQVPLLLFEGFLFVVLRRKYGDVWAWLGLGLFLAARIHVGEIGGAIDFRHDYLSGILFGAIAVAVVGSEGFRSRKLSLVAGILAAALIHTRFISVAYLLSSAPFFAAAALMPAGVDRRQRLVNLLLAVMIAVVLAIPFVAVNWDAIRSYYMENHFSRTEFESRSYGVTTFLGNLSFYVRTFWEGTLGNLWLLTAVLMTALAWWLRDRNEHRVGCRSEFIVLCGMCTPLIVLACGVHQNQVVVQVLLVPTVLALVVLVYWLRAARVAGTAAVLALLILPVNIARESTRIGNTREASGHVEAAGFLAALARRAPIDEPWTFSVADVHAALRANAIRWYRFLATQRIGSPIHGLLGHRIDAIDHELLWQQAKASDVLVVPSARSTQQLASSRQLEALRPALLAWAVDAMIEVEDLAFKLDGGDVRVFIQPGFKLRNE